MEVVLLRLTSDEDPGWVECELIDASGKRWLFEEKIPVVSDRAIGADGLPCLGFIGCTLVGAADSDGVVQIDTQEPWGIETADGQSRFTVSSKLLSRA